MSNKLSIIAGGSTGMGKATAAELVREGRTVLCQPALKIDPQSASKIDPPPLWHGGGCPGSQQGGPGRLRVAFCAARSGAARGVPVDPPGQPGRSMAGAGLRAVLEAPTLVAGFDDLAVMGEAVEQRGGHLGVAEHRGPFSEGKVGGNDD